MACDFFNPECSCLCDPDRADRRTATAKVIGSFFKGRVTGLKLKAETIIDEVRARFSVKLFYSKAWRALQYAQKLAYGTHEESWQLLPAYLQMLEVANPGTVTAIQTTIEHNFKYSFFALGQCLEGFKKFIRPVIAMDGTHLKGELSGCIFTAMTLDGSDQIYPIAFAFGPKENEAGWTWFLRNLRDAIGVREDLVLLTDRGKGIPAAVRAIFPNTPHMNCYHHLKKNLGKYCKGRSHLIDDVLWTAAYSHSKEECLYLLQTLAESCPKLHEELVKLGPKKWSHSFCPRSRWGIMTTGIAESFNRVIIPARKLPITAAHEYIRFTLQNWFCTRIISASRLDSSVTHKVNVHMQTWEPLAEKCRVYPIQDGERYQVTSEELDDGIVDVNAKSCTCNRWDLSGLPCYHVIAYTRSLSY